MRHHSAGAPALLTPLQRADNLLVNTMNRRSQVLVKEARSTEANDDGQLANGRSGFGDFFNTIRQLQTWLITNDPRGLRRPAAMQ
jgi:hypothetical protein